MIFRPNSNALLNFSPKVDDIDWRERRLISKLYMDQRIKL